MTPTHAAALAGLAACAATVGVGCVDASPTERFELEGRVVDELTDEGVPNVEVIFTSETLQRSAATTGSSGRYRMVVETDSPFGQARAEHAGYQPAERTVFFDTPVRRADLRIRPILGDL